EIQVERVERWRLIPRGDRVEYQPFTRAKMVRPENVSENPRHRDARDQLIVFRELLGAVVVDDREQQPIEPIDNAVLEHASKVVRVLARYYSEIVGWFPRRSGSQK